MIEIITIMKSKSDSKGDLDYLYGFQSIFQKEHTTSFTMGAK